MNRNTTMGRVLLFSILMGLLPASGWAQNVSGVRAFGGGVAPLFNLAGPGNLYIDNQGTQGYMYTSNTFESFNFRNPTTGQAWTGAIMTLGPQLSIGLIQGANQIGSPLVLIPPPGQPGGVMVSAFSLSALSAQGGVAGPASIFSPVQSIPVVGSNPAGASVQPVILPPSVLLPRTVPTQYPSPLEIESSLLEIP
jgi:hypothetical protein